MLQQILKPYNIILASASPRRQALFKTLDLEFSIEIKSIEEHFPKHLTQQHITDFLAELKAKAFHGTLKQNDILITSDTIVWHNNKALGKPKDKEDAFNMLRSLSHTTHDVITSICFTTNTNQKTVHAVTKVTFKALSDTEIHYYITQYLPFDKAGAYGIQDWIGQCAVTKIEGSYFNVMGLPTHLVYKTLYDMVSV